MKSILHPLLVASALLALTIQPAAQDCGTPGRYEAAIFPNVTKTSGIVFGNNSVLNYTTNTPEPPQNLLLDVYQPAGDLAVNRPLLILAFGGGFISGNRAEMEPLATAYAQKGYVVAAIDYRIVTNTNDQLLIASGTTPDAVKQAIVRDVIVKASSDVRAAVRFFRHDAATTNTYRINPAKIFVGGASAGAISALHAAYVDNVTEDPNLTAAYALNGGIEGNTDLPGNSLLGTYNSIGLAGVLNIAGAVLDTAIIDANDPPVYSAHGDADQVIPYNSGPLSIQVTYLGIPITISIPVTFYGSNTITTRANNVGVTNVLLPVPGGHEAPGQLPHILNIINQSATFAKGITCGAESPLPVRLVSFTVKASRCAAVFNWQTAAESGSSHYEIESSTDGVQFNRVATVSSRNAGNGAAYRYQLESAGRAAWFRLKMVDRDGSFSYSRAQQFRSQCNRVLSVQVYPNPTQEKATVSGLEAGMVVNVLTSDGQLIWSQRAAGNTLPLPVARFAKGLLLIQVRNEAGELTGSTRLIKN